MHSPEDQCRMNNNFKSYLPLDYMYNENIRDESILLHYPKEIYILKYNRLIVEIVSFFIFAFYGFETNVLTSLAELCSTTNLIVYQ